MNKYIRKCLIVYVSLATILCGMVGVTYAITATDADQYVTRSQYAVDMAHLQNKLDEQEAGLMGNINKYRSTDVKFVTYDTPTNYNSTSSSSNMYTGGYHNGGNYYPRKRFNNSGTQYAWGLTNARSDLRTSGNYNYYFMSRLYNGNYYIGRAKYTSGSDDSYCYYDGYKYALPIENLPGYYFVFTYLYHDNIARVFYSVYKLDPSAPEVASSTISSTALQLRFKKEFFISTADSQPLPTNTTKSSETSVNVSYDDNNRWSPTLGFRYEDNSARTGSVTQYVTKWLDPETGDYMATIRNVVPCQPGNNDRGYFIGTANFLACILLPSDNVEYMTGDFHGTPMTIDYNINLMQGYPDARYIGTGTGADAQWNYEFVDCVNGIKYWHAYNTPSKTPINGVNALGYRIHFSLPILY